MSGVRVDLNGVTVKPGDVSGEEAISVAITTTGEEQSGGPLKRAPGTLTFYGDAWELINTELIVNPDGKNRKLPVKIYDVCAGLSDFLLFEGIVRGDALNWCSGECWVEADCVEETETTKALDCIRSTLVWDNANGFLDQDHPKMVYCDEIRPEWLQWVVLSLSIIILLIFVILYPLAIVILSIIDFLNTLGANIDFDGDPSTTNLDWWNNLNNEIAARCVGCGRRHPSPLVRSYIQNVCDICGVTFSSSILNNASSDYWNLVYFNADAKKGIKGDDPSTYIFPNRPNKTLDKFLDDIVPVFNGRWRLENSVLRVERRDKLAGASAWLSVAELRTAGLITKGPCFEWEPEDKPALVEISYLPDALDISANEAGENYSEIVEWNVPYSSLQKGKKDVKFLFGASRYRNDGIEQDVLSQFLWYPPLAGAISEHERALLLNKGIAIHPKLLLWDGVSTSFGIVARYNIPGWPVPDDPNWPMQLNEHNVAPNTGYAIDAPAMGLYGRFHAINNPRVAKGKGWKFTLEFDYTRQHLVDMDLWKYVDLEEGHGEIGEITVNPETRTILVTGRV